MNMNNDERYALAEAQKQIEWEAQFAGREKVDYERMNNLLSKREYCEIERIYDEEGFGIFYNGRNKFLGLNLAMKIYTREKTVENHIFWNVDSLETLDRKVQRLKFLIWRAEYYGYEEIREMLMHYMVEQRPTEWLLIYGFAKLMLEWNLSSYAESLVSYLEKR